MTSTQTIDKLVRDLVPDHVAREGGTVYVKKLEGAPLIAALRQKLVEESHEVLCAKSLPETVGELADVIQVVRELCQHLGISPEELEEAIIRKNEVNGSFSQGIHLTSF